MRTVGSVLQQFICDYWLNPYMVVREADLQAELRARLMAVQHDPYVGVGHTSGGLKCFGVAGAGRVPRVLTEVWPFFGPNDRRKQRVDLCVLRGGARNVQLRRDNFGVRSLQGYVGGRDVAAFVELKLESAADAGLAREMEGDVAKLLRIRSQYEKHQEVCPELHLLAIDTSLPHPRFTYSDDGSWLAQRAARTNYPWPRDMEGAPTRSVESGGQGVHVWTVGLRDWTPCTGSA